MRNLRFRHRVKFWKEMQFYAQRIQSNVLLIHREAYFKLTDISDQQREAQFKFLEQNHFFLFDYVQQIVRLYWEEIPKDFIIKVLKKVNKPIIPSWQRLVSAGKEVGPAGLKGSVHHLLHTGTKRVEMISVQGKEFLKFEFESVDEARYRAVALALHTYRVKMNGGYIELF